MGGETIFEVRDGVGLLTLNRPAQRNALSREMMREDLPGLVERIGGDDSIRAVVITGAGGAFCAGADVKRMGAASPMSHAERTENLRAILGWVYDLVDLPKPVIAAVDGVAYGGGFSLALAADFILATPRARFCMVFGRIGLIPDMGAAYLLPRRIGLARAKELAFTARSITAKEAQELGIVLALHPPEALLGEATGMARRLARGSAVALREAKRLLNASPDSDRAAMIEAELQAQSACRQTAFHEEAVRRFAAKEPPLYDWDAMDRDGAT